MGPLGARKGNVPKPTAIWRDYGAKSRSQTMVDRLIAAVAEQQHGVVAIWQLLELGLGRDAIKYRASVGRLHRVHQGVYASGTASSPARATGWRPSSPTARTRS